VFDHIPPLPVAARLAPALALVLAAPALAGTTLYWTAPGDNGMSGTARQYDLRRSTQPITPANFTLADTVAGVPLPAAAGTAQSCDVALPQGGVLYYFALRTADAAGNWSALSNVFPVSAPVAAVVTPPAATRIDPPYPNPARERARLSLGSATRAWVDAIVLDATGRRVRTLAAGEREAGAWVLDWDLRDDRGRPVPDGVYLARVRVGALARTQRLVVRR